MRLLQQAMAEVMQGDGTPLQKANAVARLGNLYLKAYGTRQIQQENKALRRHVSELEKRLTELEEAPQSTRASIAPHGDRAAPCPGAEGGNGMASGRRIRRQATPDQGPAALERNRLRTEREECARDIAVAILRSEAEIHPPEEEVHRPV